MQPRWPERTPAWEERNSQLTLKWIQELRGFVLRGRFGAHDTVANKQDLISSITTQTGILCVADCGCVF